MSRLVICTAARFNEKIYANATAMTVVIDGTGNTPAHNPNANDNAIPSGVAPDFKILVKGIMTLRWNQLCLLSSAGEGLKEGLVAKELGLELLIVLRLELLKLLILIEEDKVSDDEFIKEEEEVLDASERLLLRSIILACKAKVEGVGLIEIETEEEEEEEEEVVEVLVRDEVEVDDDKGEVGEDGEAIVVLPVCSNKLRRGKLICCSVSDT